jgi:serine/threonine-protein kinase HipA
MSLAGAQHKIGLRWDGRDFFLPSGAASSHIVKPDNARAEHYPFCPANEHFCMTLARRVGLSAPDTTLIHLPEPAYIVARYDRIVEGSLVRRRHQIDLCQMLNKWPSFKYESQGGATFGEAYAALEQVRQPAVGRERLLRWLIFNYLIGNSDAHAKNISFLVDSTGYELALAYDLLSVKLYGDDEMTMSIGGEGRYGWVTADAWNTLADSLKVRQTLLRRMRAELARTLPGVTRDLLNSDDFTPEERRFLEGVALVIETHAGFALEGL